jgi:hypothetical protein
MHNVTCLEEMVTILITLCTVHARIHKIAVVERDLSASDFESSVTGILRL